MYTKSSILSAASTLVGFSSSSHSNYDSIATSLKSVDSGYYVNDLPGIGLELLDYARQEKNVSDYVSDIIASETLKTIDTFILKQKEDLNTKELLQNNTLIQDFTSFQYPITKNSRFVGYVITPRESKTITSRILQAGFISSAAQSFTLYLFDTSNYTAIQTKTISINSVKTIEWTALDWDISFDRDSGSAGQRYLIGYFEDDLTETFYDDYWNGQNSHVAQRIFGHYMGVSPIRFNNGVLNGTNLPDCFYLQSAMVCRTPGFNLRFNTKCDITKILVDNIDMFAEALQYKLAIRILSDCLSSITLTNVNNAQQLRDRWQQLLDEYNGKLNGGITEAGIPVKGIIDRLSLDFSDMDGVCLKRQKGQITKVRW